MVALCRADQESCGRAQEERLWYLRTSRELDRGL